MINVMGEIHQRVPDGFGMSVEWALRIVVPIFKRNGDVRKFSCYRAIKLLVHGMKMLDRVLDKRLYRIVTVNEVQFSSMPKRRKNLYCVYLEKSARTVSC